MRAELNSEHHARCPPGDELAPGVAEPIAKPCLAVVAASATGRPADVVGDRPAPVVHADLEPRIARDTDHHFDEVGMARNSRHTRIGPGVVDALGNRAQIDHVGLLGNRLESCRLNGRQTTREPLGFTEPRRVDDRIRLLPTATKGDELLYRLVASVGILANHPQALEFYRRRLASITRIDRDRIQHTDEIVETIVSHQLWRLVFGSDGLDGEKGPLVGRYTLWKGWASRRHRRRASCVELGRLSEG